MPQGMGSARTAPQSPRRYKRCLGGTLCWSEFREDSSSETEFHALVSTGTRRPAASPTGNSQRAVRQDLAASKGELDGQAEPRLSPNRSPRLELRVAAAAPPSLEEWATTTAACTGHMCNPFGPPRPSSQTSRMVWCDQILGSLPPWTKTTRPRLSASLASPSPEPSSPQTLAQRGVVFCSPRHVLGWAPAARPQPPALQRGPRCKVRWHTKGTPVQCCKCQDVKHSIQTTTLFKNF